MRGELPNNMRVLAKYPNLVGNFVFFPIQSCKKILFDLAPQPMPIERQMPTEPCTAIDLFCGKRGEPMLGKRVSSGAYERYPHIINNNRDYGTWENITFNLHPEIALAITLAQRPVGWKVRTPILLGTSHDICWMCYEWLKTFGESEDVTLEFQPWGGMPTLGWMAPDMNLGSEITVEISNKAVEEFFEKVAAKVVRRWKEGSLSSLSRRELVGLRQAQQLKKLMESKSKEKKK
ncbi:hypothetical protein TWF481_007605 [Arthrobotrys musiformis]|uniref:Uncharacterized protein n=1 Tax=Arthrobotrys musiformis TaxID=47236 RepID=A0AAV9WDI7_9PEZI